MKNYFIRFLLLVAIIVCSDHNLSLATELLNLENGTQYRIDTVVENGLSPHKGDIIKMKLKKYSPDGVLVFNTDALGHPDGVEMTIDNFIGGDILDVLLKLKPGETATAFVPIWVADQDEAEKESGQKYKYVVTLVSYKTQSDLKAEQKTLLKKLRIDQKILFNKITDSLSPRYKNTFQKDGLYILKTNNRKVKKKNRIKSGQTVSVHYVLKLLPDYLELDNSHQRKTPYTFKVDNGEAIQGWDIALMQLQEGDYAIVLVPSWLAYGFSGSGGDIPPNTPLYFEIEVQK